MRSKVLSGDKNINLGEVFEYYKNINPKVGKGWAARHVGEILLNIDDQRLSEAEDWVKKAIEADESNGTMWSLGLDINLLIILKYFAKRDILIPIQYLRPR